MTEEAGERFAGLAVLEAREAVVEALEAEGRIARHRAATSTVSRSRTAPASGSSR